MDIFWTFYLNHLSPLWGYFFIAMVKFVHESEALNVVSGASDTILIGKAYMTYIYD